MGLTGKTPGDTYLDLFEVDNSNNGVDSTIRQVKTGNGASSAISISDRALKVKSATNNTTALDIQNASGASKFVVDTTNNQVKSLGTHVNTQYAYFGVGDTGMANILADTHYAVPFKNFQTSGSVDIDFGTGTDPDTTFTTADTDTQWGSQIVPMMWFVPDNISIDGVTSIEGADANLSGGDATTRMHLLSYTFTSGSTSALSSGTLLAHNSDVTNSGNESAYLSNWTVDSASVAAGKVILAFFRTDNVNADYSLNIIIKYHLT